MVKGKKAFYFFVFYFESLISLRATVNLLVYESRSEKLVKQVTQIIEILIKLCVKLSSYYF